MSGQPEELDPLRKKGIPSFSNCSASASLMDDGHLPTWPLFAGSNPALSCAQQCFLRCSPRSYFQGGPIRTGRTSSLRTNARPKQGLPAQELGQSADNFCLILDRRSFRRRALKGRPPISDDPFVSFHAASRRSGLPAETAPTSLPSVGLGRPHPAPARPLCARGTLCE